MADTDDTDWIDDIDYIDDIDWIFEQIAEKFNYLYHQLGSSREARVNAISELPQLTLDFYVVAEVVSLTREEGLGTWIDHHHHDEPEWIDCAVEAFTRIGYPQVGDGIKSCRAVYLAKGGTMDYEDCEVPSDYIGQHTLEIMKALISYLAAHDFSFRADSA